MEAISDFLQSILYLIYTNFVLESFLAEITHIFICLAQLVLDLAEHIGFVCLLPLC